ncbi:MAG: hypothetical protein ACXVCE_11000 [Bacteriovorax sp.]|jgi:hypothetical protein
MKKLLLIVSLTTAVSPAFAEDAYKQPDQFLSISYKSCEDLSNPPPICLFQGTDKEGWYVNGKILEKLKDNSPFYTKCSQGKVTCYSDGGYMSFGSNYNAHYPEGVNYDNNFID